MASEIALALAVAIAAVGAAWDVRSRRIPNVVALLLALAAISATAIGAGWAGIGSVAIHASIVLVVGMLLFAARMIGAGDAKFYTAAALAIPLDRALPMLGWVAFSGLALVAVMIVWHRGLKITRGGEKRSWTLPYGVPIFCGFLAESLPRLGVNL